MLRSIAPAANLKNSREKTTLLVFFVLSTWLVPHSGIHGILLLPLMLLTTTAEKRTLFADYHPCVYSRGIAGFTDQRTAFTRAQGAILQSQDFNLRVQRALKYLIHEAKISETDPVTPLF